MFPNDDICNLKAAKNAARRIFDRYNKTNDNVNSSNGLGQQQVSNLIKNAYNAINIPYDPSNQDVFSFMSIFGAQSSGNIQLDKLEELAVKYLCGQDALLNDLKKKQTIDLSSSTDNEIRKLKQINMLSDPVKKKSHQNNKNILNMEIKQNYRKQQRMLQMSPKAVSYSNKLSFNNNLKTYKSAQKLYYESAQKHYHESTQNNNYQSSQKPQHKKRQKPILTPSQIIAQSTKIFNQYKSLHQNIIRTTNYKQVLKKTYQLVGKRNYNPTDDDVNVWIRLCDSRKSGVVDSEGYHLFINRLINRENLINT